MKRLLLLVILSLGFLRPLISQRFFTPMNAAEVEQQKCGSYIAGSSTYVIPDPDSIRRYKIKSSTEKIQINSAGTLLNGTVVTAYNRRGYIISSVETDDNPGKGPRKFETLYAYSQNYDRALILSMVNDSVTALDSVYFYAYNKPTLRRSISSGALTIYTYGGNKNQLTAIHTSDPGGTVWERTLRYDHNGKLLLCMEMELGANGSGDTLEYISFVRDEYGRIISHSTFSKYSFSFLVSNPDSIIYTRLRDDYEYDQEGRVIKYVTSSSDHPEPLRYEYSYDNQGRLEWELIQRDDSTWTKRQHVFGWYTDTINIYVHYTDYWNRGPCTLLKEKEIVTYNDNGQWVSWNRISLIPGMQGPIQDDMQAFDKKGRMTMYRSYSYDYETLQPYPWSATLISYYKNGLEKSHVMLQKDDVLNTSRTTTFKYYW